MKKFILTLFTIIFGVFAIKAQDSELAPVTGTVAITKVNIIPSPGEFIERGTVVVSDGVITAVGKNVTIPPGARVVQADSMYLYAGFMLGMSHAGIKMPDDNERPDVKEPANPPDDVAGIQPERTVHDYLSPDSKSIGDLRELGFTVAQTSPEKGMLPGTASVIVLKGSSTDEMIIVPGTALYATFDGARRVYPATIIGVMAKFRELYRQSEQAKKFRKMYSDAPTGMKRPYYDRTWEAFYPVIDKKIPVAYKAEEVLNAQRAMLLQKDLGFNLMLTELKEGWDLVDDIKSSNTKVLFSLDLPEYKEDEKDSAKENTSAEKKMLEQRKGEFAKKYYGQMALFAQNNIPFGFSSIDLKTKDFHGNMRKMIENGLTEDQALAALTTTPASMLGMSQAAGTVSSGKMANMVISTKPYFDEDSKVKYVMVEGKLYEYSTKEKKAANPEVKKSVVGSWTYSSATSGGTVTGTIEIEEQDGVLSGTISNSMSGQTSPMKDLSVSGSSLVFSFDVDTGQGSITVEAVVEVDGDTFEGSLSAMGDSFPVEGSKNPGLN